jgi:phage terminase large subunit-like protein
MKKTPQEYWQDAREYIKKLESELSIEDKYYVDRDFAMKCIKFGSLMKLTAGEFAGQPFMYQQWQIETIVNIFGVKYKHGDFKGLRRYKKALLFTPKKSGKTAFGSLLTMIYFFLDKEKAKECYSIASEIEQAKILWKSFVTMIRQEDELMDMVHITKQPPKVSKMSGAFIDEYTALSSTADSKDGLNVSMLLVDEPHTFTSKDLYDILSNGQAGRQEPLEIFMSTAGFNMQNFFYREIYLYAKKIKNGVIKDDSFYYIMFEPDEKDLENDDFWKDRELWKRVNPNIGVSPTYSYLESRLLQAEQSEQSLISFKTKHLNCWVDKADIWIKHSVWTANQTPINEDDLIGRTCYGGLDLSSSIDITAIGYIFPKDDGGYDFIVRLFIPKDNMRERVRRDKVPYFDWVKNGIMQVTDGNVIDYAFIQKQIEQDAEKFNIKMMAYDRWNSSDLITRLTNDGTVELVQFGQGFASMSAPTKQIEVLALQGRLNHGNNEALNWMCSNVVLKRDPADNIKMDKSTSVEKIDGMVALAMSLGICMIDTKEEEKELIYNERGLIDL